MGDLYPRISIRELRLQHFRAFKNARLDLDDLTVLVGRNGSGKSSVMESLDFLRDALYDSLVNALERRDGLEGIRERQSGRGMPPDVSIAVALNLDSIPVAYGVRLGARANDSGFVVKEETLQVAGSIGSFRRDERSFDADTKDVSPAIDPESLLLPTIAGRDPLWKKVLAALRGIRTYVLSPAQIREEPRIGKQTMLDRDGSNAGDVLKRLQSDSEEAQWIVRHLAAITTGIRGVEARSGGGRRLLEFEQAAGPGRTRSFWSYEMSDGTLRSLGVLLALRQKPHPLLVCIDEIEDSIHPSALSVLLDAIDATVLEGRCQVVISSHSPEALGHPAVTAQRVRILQWTEGVSQIFALGEGVQKLLKPPQSIGRLLRSNALWPAEQPCEIAKNRWNVPA